MLKIIFTLLYLLIIPATVFSFQVKNDEMLKNDTKRDHFNIAVWKVNSAYAYSMNVIMNDSLTTVKFVGGVVGEKPETLWTMKNTSSLVDSARHFLQNACLDTMQRHYDDPSVIDGMIIVFKINYRNKDTKVQLNNVWIQPLYDLAIFINAHLPEKYKLGLVPLK